jgi:hypothetical protein
MLCALFAFLYLPLEPFWPVRREHGADNTFANLIALVLALPQLAL